MVLTRTLHQGLYGTHFACILATTVFFGVLSLLFCICVGWAGLVHGIGVWVWDSAFNSMGVHGKGALSSLISFARLRCLGGMEKSCRRGS